MAAVVWNKLTSRLSTWFGDEKQSRLRPSHSLLALNHKNLRVAVRPSKSSENLHRISTVAVCGSSNDSTESQKIFRKALSKKTSARDILRLPTRKKKSSPKAKVVEVGGAPRDVPMSLSWHSHITDVLQREPEMEAGPSHAHAHEQVLQVGPDGHIIAVDRVPGAAKPKRSKSIIAMNNEAIRVGGNGMPRPGQGFRTPQSLAGFKCQQPIDPHFWEVQGEAPLAPADAQFRRLEKIGEGSYATVLKGENRFDGSIVALKEIKLHPNEGLPFTAIREISLLRTLKHANIVRLHQIVHQPDSLVLVFEFVRTDLSRFMENYRNGLDSYRTKIFLFQLLRGLAYCHDRKILHRDLKPQNLLVSENNELKLADFGLARAKSVPCRTFSHDVVTLWYRPPDVLLGSTHYSTSLDMWGVGCIFAEMLTGMPIFPGINDASDQLERIFSVRGVPCLSSWPEVADLPSYKGLRFRPYVELSWKRVHPTLGRLTDEGGRLLTAFLQLNPAKRISANAAMLHGYFSTLPPEVHLLKPTESLFAALPGAFR